VAQLQPVHAWGRVARRAHGQAQVGDAEVGHARRAVAAAKLPGQRRGGRVARLRDQQQPVVALQQVHLRQPAAAPALACAPRRARA